MRSQHCVLDLQGYGRVFRKVLLDLGLKKELDLNAEMSVSELDFAYNECTSQIISALSLDMVTFFSELRKMPDMSRLAHIQQFNGCHNKFLHDSQFSIRLHEYAMGLVGIVTQTLTIEADVDYLLEALAEDYIIIMRISKVNPHA